MVKLTTPHQEHMQIVRDVAKDHKVSVSEILGGYRDARIIIARHAAYAAVWKATGWPYTRVARFFNREHTTVIYGIGAHLYRQGKRYGPVKTYLNKTTRNREFYRQRIAA